MADSDSEPESHMNMFVEPADYYPPTPPPTTQLYTLASGQTITLHLVGYSPTEAHHLWNGSRVISEWFEANPSLVHGQTILELGAGAGLPSIVAGLLGARRVVVTDYPDVDILATLQKNVDECRILRGAVAARPADEDVVVVPKGFIWGADPRPLLAALPSGETKFDVLILADLLFRHSEHGKMLDTIRDTLKRNTRSSSSSKAFVFFTSYRPWLQHKDLAFFDLARARGFTVDKVLEKKMDRPMFEDDPGDEEVRKTCTGWVVKWPEEAVEGEGEGEGEEETGAA